MPADHSSATTTPQRNILVLQGGGALGAYQAGAFEALATARGCPEWVAGVSIGAINAALIAGNPPERRLARLRAFWERVSSLFPLGNGAGAGDWWRSSWGDAAAWWGALLGIPGFFRPRPAWAWWPEPPGSIYDTEPLRETLLELVDFDLVNSGAVRLSVGAVDVESGNRTYFDSHEERIGPEHVMASGALPPGFPPIRIDGRAYWDGGLVSNTPLAYVMHNLEGDTRAPVAIFQVDLFNARGAVPGTLAATTERMKDIRYSSRTRQVSAAVRQRHDAHERLHAMAALLPEKTRRSQAVRELLADAAEPPVTLVQIIHRRKPYETQSKDYEFSRLSMNEHWAAGDMDMRAALALPGCRHPAAPGEFRILDPHPDHPRGRRARRGCSGSRHRVDPHPAHD